MTEQTMGTSATQTGSEPYRPDVVIYHDHCADGFGAAWACWMRWRGQCDYVPASYGKDAPDVQGKHVLIVDFSYKADTLRHMARAAKSIIVLDHHKTAQADLADWQIDDVAGEFWAGDNPMKLVRENDDYIGQPIAALFDMEKSGAVLAWEFCHEEPVPMLLRLIQDRDLWRFTMEETKPFSLWLRSEPFTFERFELLAQELEDGHDAHRILTEANAMQRFFEAKVAETVRMARWEHVGGYTVMAVNCPPWMASEVGHAILEEHPSTPFAACYSDQGNSRGFSLRSSDDKVDVSEVAKKFGGGGHRNAAGFGVPRI